MSPKFSPALITTLTISFLLSQTAFAIDSIKDVKPQDPNAGIYGEIVKNGAISLDKQGNFRPNETINKAAFLKAALNYAGYKPGQNFNFFTGYSDVPEESWFAPYVKKALDIRALSNHLGDQFSPDQTLTRQEALLFAMNIYGIPTPLIQPTSDDLYKDIRTTHPLASTYASAHNHGIYFENDQEYFHPAKTLTRGDAANLLFTAKLASGNSGTVVSNDPSSNDNNSSSDFINSEDFTILQDTWNHIHNDFVYTDKIDENKLFYGAISGMVSTLGDPYSVFRAPNNDGNSYVYVPDNYVGVGIVIDLIDNNYTIQTVISNSPADRAGLKAKDIITSISGQDIGKKTMDEVMAMVKGEAGSILQLSIKRDNQVKNFSITREKITINSIYQDTLSNNISYLRIDQFTELKDNEIDTSDEFNTAIEAIKKSGSKKIIIDLRNNPGGYLNTTQTMLGHFIDKGQPEFWVEDKSGNPTPYASSATPDLKDYKIVILINEDTASAAEITAGALQDYKLAYLIGTTSFGKGSVQELIYYKDNSSLKLTIAKWLTAKQRSINHVGLTPDQVVTITDAQKASGADPQLDAAKAYLNK